MNSNNGSKYVLKKEKFSQNKILPYVDSQDFSNFLALYIFFLFLAPENTEKLKDISQ